MCDEEQAVGETDKETSHATPVVTRGTCTEVERDGLVKFAAMSEAE